MSISSINRGILAGFALVALSVGATSAQAATLSGVFNISIYQADTTGSGINSASQQAVADNPLIVAGNLVGQGVFTGPLDFADNTPAKWMALSRRFLRTLFPAVRIPEPWFGHWMRPRTSSALPISR